MNARGSAKNNNRTVEYTERAFDFDGEVYVSGGIDDIDSEFIELVIHASPEACRRRRCDRDAALLLLLHPIHGGSTVVHLTYLVRDAGIEQNTFSGSGFTGIDVGANSDIAIAVNRGFASHVDTSSL